MATDASSLVKQSRDGDVVVLRFHRPDSLNAMTLDMLDQFHERVERLENAPPRALCITGTGETTTAGMDLSIAEAETGSPEEVAFTERLREIMDLVETFPRPTLMAGKGALVGAGFILSLVTDFVVLGNETTYSLPEVNHAIPPDPAYEPLLDVVNHRVAKELIYTGDGIGPERAATLGLVNECVSEAEVDDAALAFLDRIVDQDHAYDHGFFEQVGADIRDEID